MFGKSKQRKILICIGLSLIKLLYIYSVVVLLPEKNLLWSFNKCISYSNIVFETIPFLMGLILYINSYFRNNVYTYFLTLFFILFFVPINSGMVLSNNNLDYYLLANLFSLMVIYLISRMSKKEQLDYEFDENFDTTTAFDFFSNRKLTWTIRIVSLIVCILTIIYVYRYNRLNFAIIYQDMYSVRSEYASYAQDIQGTTASYLSLIITKTSGWFLPVYLYFSLIKKKPIDVMICLFTLVANYTVEMQKTSLFIIAVVIFVWVSQIINKVDRISELLLKGFIILFIISIFEYYLRGESLVFSVFLRRLTYVPSYLTNIYYDFFKNNTKVWLTQDVFVLQWIVCLFIKRPYTGSTVSVISNNCFSGRLASPNTGIFAEAYAQMGVVGVFVFPFIDSYIVKKMKQASEIYGSGVVYIVLSKVCFTFLNNFVLATSTIIGIVIFIIISYFIKKIAIST